jgi:ABC-2 type transport system permease protein
MTVWSDLHLYSRYIGVSIRSQMQYRASFVMLTIGHLAGTGIEFVGILVLFDRFGSLQGWSLPEVAFLYGLVNVGFAFADAATRGFDMFATMVKSGDFDRLLTRPRSTAIQLAGQELTLRRVGRLAQGLVILLWASAALDLDWTVAKAALTLAAIASGTALFSGLVILQATLAFWTTESVEIMNTVTYGGVQTSQLPLVIYRPWFRKFFTFVVPLACVSYFPAIAIIGRTDPLGSPIWFQYLSPLIGVGFLLVSLQVWKFGVRHYVSTGS